MITDFDHFYFYGTGELYMFTGQIMGRAVVRATEHRGSDIVHFHGDLWRAFQTAGMRDPLDIGDHRVYPLAYDPYHDVVTVIVRRLPPKPLQSPLSSYFNPLV